MISGRELLLGLPVEAKVAKLLLSAHLLLHRDHNPDMVPTPDLVRYAEQSFDLLIHHPDVEAWIATHDGVALDALTRMVKRGTN